MRFVSSSVEDTQDLARAFAQAVAIGDVILLVGDLGAGKTHFTQGLAAGLGISQLPTSPTFNIVCEYRTGRIPLYHFDLYRLEDPLELEDVDYFGIIEGDGVSCVEWGDKFQEAAPEDHLLLDFRVTPEGDREITATAFGHRHQDLLNDALLYMED